MPISGHIRHGLDVLAHGRLSGKGVLGIFVWLGLLTITLLLASVRSSWSGAICGPWGCTGPLEAVVACHLAWMVILGPLVIGIVRHNSRRWHFIVGVSLVTFAVVVLLTLCAFSLYESLAIPGAMKYVWQRMALKVVGFVDLPVFAALVWGGWCFMTVGKRPSGPAATNIIHHDAETVT